MKFSRAASWFTRVAILFLLMCMALLFTAAAIELKRVHQNEPDSDDGQVMLPASIIQG